MTGLPEGYELVAEQARIDPAAAHAYLTRSYWAQGIPYATVAKSIANSLCMAVFHSAEQVAFARVISNRATFAYLADVYVIEAHRGRGLSHALLAALDAHPELRGLRRWALFTQDAQALYRAHGWEQYPHPERMMVRDDPAVYG